MINTLTNIGLPSATFRIYNDREDPTYRKQTLGSAQALFMVIATIAAGLIILFSYAISDLLVGNPLSYRVIRLVAVLLIFETINIFGNILLRLQVKPVAASIQSLIFVSSQIGIALLLIYYYDLGVLGYWLGYLAGAIIGSLVIIWINRQFIEFEISIYHIKELLNYGLPLVPATFSLNLIRLTDNYLIRSLISVDQVAVYAIGYKIGSLVNMVIGPFNVAWPNFAFSTMHEPDAKNTYRDIITFLLAGSIFTGLGVFIFRDDLVSILAPATYLDASRVVIWIIMAMVAFGLYPVLSLGPKIKRQTFKLAWISVFTAVINIILNLVFIPRFGIIGVALSTFISYFLLALISYLVSQRLYSIPLDLPRITKVIFSMIATGLIVELLIPSGTNHTVNSLLRLCGFLLYPIFLLLLKFTSLEDIRLVIQMALEKIKGGLNPQKISK